MFAPSRSPELPPSFQRWSEVDILVGSEDLCRGPAVGKIRTLAQWRAAYGRWQSGYDAFVKVAEALPDGETLDDLDRRQYEHYSALFLQSGQWHAILLRLLRDVIDSERSQYQTEIDGILADLRRGLCKTNPAT